MNFIIDIETVCDKIKQFANNDIDIIYRSYFDKGYLLLRKHKRYNTIGQEYVLEKMMSVENILLYTEQTIAYINEEFEKGGTQCVKRDTDTEKN